MLRALHDYAVRENLTLPPGYANKPIKAYISLYADGSFQGVEMGKREPVPCPDIGSLANGTDKSNVLAEKSSLVLPEAPNAKSDFFLKALIDAGTQEPAAALCAAALQDEATRQAIAREFSRLKIKPSDRVSFLVDGEPLLQREGIVRWWQAFRKPLQKSTGGAQARCMITGEMCRPVATVLPVNGLQVVGGHARGDALICFDKPSFCSYDQKQALNAPVSEAAMSAVKAALDHLLKDAPVLAGMKFVHWYDRPVPAALDPCEDLIGGDGAFASDEAEAELEEEVDDRTPQQERIKATGLVTSARSGNEVVPLSANYFILLLSGAGGRVMIRRYEHGRYQELCERLQQWYEDLRLGDLGGASYTKPFKLTARLIRLLKRQKGNDDVMKRLSKELAGITPAVLTAILTGAQFPEAVLMRALAYIRSQMLDSDENNIQIPEAIACQWLKAWLCRRERTQGEVVTMPFVNPEHPNRAYHLGRMVAVYARIQQAALGKVNAGVVERYYASASQTPALVLGQLDKLANHHLAKISNSGTANRLSEDLEEISVAVGESIPVTLTLEEQAYFALGYRQQCAEINRRRAEADAAKKERSNNAPDRETAKEE